MNAKASIQQGFSLIELIAVIILLGIISISVMGRLDVRGFEEEAYISELLNATRYTQKIAVANNCMAVITLNSSGFNIRQTSNINQCTNAATTIPVINPSTGGSYSNNTKPTALTFTPSTGSIFFYGDGRTDNNTDLSMFINGAINSHLCIVQTTGYAFKNTAACP